MKEILLIEKLPIEEITEKVRGVKPLKEQEEDFTK